jgi:hypothetical protein
MKRYPFTFLLCLVGAAACDVHVDRRTTANETATFQNLRTLRSMLLTYRSECGGFPARLQVLIGESTVTACHPRPKTSPFAARADAVSVGEWLNAISVGPVSGYRYVYVPTDAANNTSGLFQRFTVRAVPVEPGISGEASFLASDSEDVKFRSPGQ